MDNAIDSKRHSGIISHFRKGYIKTGIFPVEASDIIGASFEIRNASDYDDMFIASKSEAEEQIRNARRFYDIVAPYVEEKLKAN